MTMPAVSTTVASSAPPNYTDTFSGPIVTSPSGSSRPLEARDIIEPFAASVDPRSLRFLFPDASSNTRHLPAGHHPSDLYRARSATVPLPSFESHADLLTTLVGILYQQIRRLGSEIARSLADIRQADDETCHEVEEHLAFLIYLLGEPGLYGAKQALNRLPVEDDDSETLIRSIARSAGPESLNAVTKVLSECLSANDARMRYSAAAALAGLGSEDVRRIFEQALANEANMSVKNLMESALRSKIYGTSG